MKTQLMFTTFLLLLTTESVRPQDTLKLDLHHAEQLFIEGNYQLIAQQYQTAQAKAEIITAKLFENPELSYENLFYNHETGKFLETSMATGQFSGQISQLIKLAGKRNKNIQLATAGARVAEYAYFDVMRTLRYDLRSNFYKAFYTQKSAAVYKTQIAALEHLLNASEKQLSLGNVAVKDIIRIKSLVFTLKAEYSALLNDLEDLQTTIKMMTNIQATTPLLLQISLEEETSFNFQKLPLLHLLDSARENRADLRLAKAEIGYAEQNLKLQKAMAVPDLELSLSYDLKGNYPEKYTGLGLKIPIPLFNRNQGEIKKARIAVDAGTANLQQKVASLDNEVYNSYRSAIRTEELYQGLDPNFGAEFTRLLEQVTKNFQRRNLSLIEFLDFYDSYKENTLKINNLKYERMNAKEEINYVTGAAIFK